MHPAYTLIASFLQAAGAQTCIRFVLGSALCEGTQDKWPMSGMDPGKMGSNMNLEVVWWVRILLRLARVTYLCLLEGRPTVQGIFALRFLAGASFAGSLWNWWVWSTGTTWFLAVWAVYLLNGITDVVEDRINHSVRPMVSERLGANEARIGVAVLAGASFAVSLIADHPSPWSVACLLVLGWSYSAPPLRLKRWPAGLVAVTIVAALLTYHAGYAANGKGEDVTALLLFAVMMAFWMGLVGQTKDIPDLPGDAKAGRRSIPVVWGEETARRGISASALSIGGAFLILATLFAKELLPQAMAVGVGAAALATVTLGPWSRGEGSILRRPYRVFMLTQYAANATVVLFWGVPLGGH